jgi:hypothetical protein
VIGAAVVVGIVGLYVALGMGVGGVGTVVVGVVVAGGSKGGTGSGYISSSSCSSNSRFCCNSVYVVVAATVTALPPIATTITSTILSVQYCDEPLLCNGRFSTDVISMVTNTEENQPMTRNG